MTSKRNLKRDLHTLREEAVTADPSLSVVTYGRDYETRVEAPRPELTVPNNRGGFETATPAYVSAVERSGPVLTVGKTITETWNGDYSDSLLPASTLWDRLTEAQLQEERRRRQANDDPLPPLLEVEYAPE